MFGNVRNRSTEVLFQNELRLASVARFIKNLWRPIKSELNITHMCSRTLVFLLLPVFVFVVVVAIVVLVVVADVVVVVYASSTNKLFQSTVAEAK